MKIKSLRGFLLVWFCPLLSYMEKSTWQTVQKESQLSPEVEQKLTEFFSKHEKVKDLFTHPSFPALAMNAFVPNQYLPGTFDETFHVRPCAWVEIKNESVVPDKVLESAGLKNLSHNNIVISLAAHGLPYVLIGTTRQYHVFPTLISRYCLNEVLKDYCAGHALKRIRFPRTYLYHIPGQPDEPTDFNWLVVQEYISHIPWQAMRKHFIWMQALYDCSYGHVSLQEKEEAARIGKRYENRLLEDLEVPQIRQKALYEWNIGKMDPSYVKKMVQSLWEFKRFIEVTHKYFPDSLLHYSTDEETIIGSNILLVEDKEEGYVFYYIDLSLPQGPTAEVNEKLTQGFTGKKGQLVSYESFLHSIGIYPEQDLFFLTHVTSKEQGIDALLTLPNRFEQGGVKEPSSYKWLSDQVNSIAELLNLKVKPAMKK